MRRYHLFEFNDQHWVPSSLRDAGTDMLGLVLNTGKHYGSIVPQLRQGLQAVNAKNIIDLCSGGGGPWKTLSPELDRSGTAVDVLLTDKFPNIGSFEAAAKSSDHIQFRSDPVDATQMPPELNGFRTLFTALHHFRPDTARAILADAVRNRVGIGIFEFTYRLSWPLLIATFLFAALGTVLIVFLAIPFVRPFRWSTLLLTYVIPLFPLIAIWDGTVSCMRTYKPAEMLEMGQSVSGDDYQWTAGTVRTRASIMPVSYLVGVPVREDSATVASNNVHGEQSTLL